MIASLVQQQMAVVILKWRLVSNVPASSVAVQVLERTSLVAYTRMRIGV
jgi:hypothetical protein